MKVKITTATGSHVVEVDRAGGTTEMCKARFLAYIQKARAQGGYLLDDANFVPLEAVQMVSIDKY